MADFTNRLIKELSPYLLQHAHNPVDWYPWSVEAFDIALAENKPIFLSIGYSTCHWCHVMEKESFEDPEVAKELNHNFICIKVDREERPDIDHIYMSVCQMLTGSGGWPLTIVMTPDQKPFFAGTYFPKSSRGNRIGLIKLIPKIKSVWINQREEIEKSANEITSHLNSELKVSTANRISSEIFEKAYEQYRDNYDSEYGGFGNRPKFPSPHNLSFLMRYHKIQKNEYALDMVIKTLTEMRKGGIFDHIGYGFHRYSTDRKWFVPHFEKMLYDQAMLIIAYSELYQLTENPLFKQTVDEIIKYVLRDMTSQDGGFFSAEDADSEGEEGKFYLWEWDEIESFLNKRDSELIRNLFNFVQTGNYYDEATGINTGKNLPFINSADLNFDIEENNDGNELIKKIESIRLKMFEYREKRIHPLKDDKILTDWNGLMVAALSIASRTFNRADYFSMAKRGINFILDKMSGKEGELFHRFRNGDIGIIANLDDYAFTIWGLLELFEICFEAEDLKSAIEFSDHVIENFWDKENNNGFYFTSLNGSNLIARSKEFYDGAIPSGNSVMHNNLERIGKITALSKYDDIIENMKKSYSTMVEKTPTAFSNFLSGAILNFSESYEVIVTGDRKSEKTKKIINEVNSLFNTNKIMIVIDNENISELKKLIPYLSNYSIDETEPLIYVCKNYECSLPTSDINEALNILKK